MTIGIDFGAKTSGTTVIARLCEINKVDFYAAAKGENADDFILDYIDKNQDIWQVYIDAPLSLPNVYRNPEKGDDYFFRCADRMTGAMSPMFLGGLTARAMTIAKKLSEKKIKVIETYPAKLAKVLNLPTDRYKKDQCHLAELSQFIKEESGFDFDVSEVKNWHYFDALLCLYSAKRNEMQSAMVFGEESEGVIIV